MRVLVLAGLVSVLTAPGAFASESTEACQLEEARRRGEPAAAPVSPAQAEAAPRAAAPAAAASTRRRSGKRIPDAELIGPRGAL